MTRRRSRIPVGSWGRLLALVVATVATAATAGPAAARPSGPLVPERGVLFGAFVYHRSSARTPLDQVRSFETLIGRRLDIDQRFHPLTGSFPTRTERASAAEGRTLLLTWEPDRAGDLRAIVAGTYDRVIDARARALASLDTPVFVRFAHEMNGNWYPWSGVLQSTPGTHDGPSVYRAAFRHVVDRFRAVGARNVIWVWSPNWKSIPQDDWNRPDAYYPGDDYVDWVGLGGYNRGPSSVTHAWRELREIIAPINALYGDRKPIMIAETGSVEEGGSKAAWITRAATALERTFPSVAAVVWFDGVKQGLDWRVDSSASALAAYRDWAQSSYATTRRPDAPTPVLTPASPREGVALTLDPGAATSPWADAPIAPPAIQWQICRFGACTPLATAHGTGFTPGAGEVRARLRVAVTWTSPFGSYRVVSAMTPAVQAGTPTPAGLPTISGRPVATLRLDAAPATWVDHPASATRLTRRWQRCAPSGDACADIRGATGPSLLLGPADVGATVRVVDRAENAYGALEQVSDPFGPVHAAVLGAVDLPSITGDAVFGQELQAHPGTWDGLHAVTGVTRTWLRCDANGDACSPVDPDPGDTLPLTTDDAGATFRIAETATDGVDTVTATSLPTAPVGDGSPSFRTVPTLAGSPADASVLRARADGAAGAGTLVRSYAWERCDASGGRCAPLAGSRSSLRLRTADVGTRVRAIVTITSAYGSVSQATALTRTVRAAPPVLVAPPRLKGTARTGRKVRATRGRWLAGPVRSYGYAFLRCSPGATRCRTIVRNDTGTYRVRRADRGHLLRVVVSAVSRVGVSNGQSPAVPVR